MSCKVACLRKSPMKAVPELDIDFRKRSLG
jgi:hypothetical protein